jgi:glutamate synthase (NADPH) large chain
MAPIEATIDEVGPHRARLARPADEPDCLGHTARAAMPTFKQLFVSTRGATGIDLDRKAFVARKRSRARARAASSTPTSRRCRRARSSTRACSPRRSSASSSPTCRSARRVRAAARALAVLDQHVPVVAAGAPVPVRRPQRRDQHRAGQPELDARREAMLRATCCPASSGRSRSARPGASDTARFDEVLELLHLGGRPAAPRHADDDPRGVGEPRDDGRRTSATSTASTPAMMEPWDGPASVAFTDGTVIGAVLDRNGCARAATG